jgi:hypothetical protein
MAVVFDVAFLLVIPEGDLLLFSSLFPSHNNPGAPSIAALRDGWDEGRQPAVAVAVVAFASAVALCLSRRPSLPNPGTVISTEAAHALCEQRSREIRFSASGDRPSLLPFSPPPFNRSAKHQRQRLKN